MSAQWHRFGGAGVAVVAPPAGAFLAGGGTLAVIAGDGLTFAANILDGDYAAAGNQLFDAGVGRLTGRSYRNLAQGAWRNPTSGRFERNPLGGAYRTAKERAAAAGAERVSGAAGKAVRCGRP